MDENNSIQLFEDRKIRTAWDEEKEEWYFSVVDVIAQMYPDKEIRVANAEGLKECKKLLQLAKAGKYNGYLLEGMACPGGCVAGAGTINVPEKSAAENLKSKKSSPFETACESPYVDILPELENLYNEFSHKNNE